MFVGAGCICLFEPVVGCSTDSWMWIFVYRLISLLGLYLSSYFILYLVARVSSHIGWMYRYHLSLPYTLKYTRMYSLPQKGGQLNCAFPVWSRFQNASYDLKKTNFRPSEMSTSMEFVPHTPRPCNRSTSPKAIKAMTSFQNGNQFGVPHYRDPHLPK